jgi:hypothetical protein
MKPLRLVTEGFKMSTLNVTFWTLTRLLTTARNKTLAWHARNVAGTGVAVCDTSSRARGLHVLFPHRNSVFARQSNYWILLVGDLRPSVHFVGGLHRVDGRQLLLDSIYEKHHC